MTDALKQARDALVRAEACILVDRTAVMDCHTGPDGIDDEGAAALDDYDDALLTIRAAIARADAARAAPVVTDAMVTAYLNANDAYWHRHDEIPPEPDKWCSGTAREATAESLRAAFAAITSGEQS